MAAETAYRHYEVRQRGPDAAHAALLVIDMQEYFRGIASPILPAIQRTIVTCRAAQIPIIYTRHAHKDSSDHGMLGEWWHNVIHDDSPEAELIPEVGRTGKDKLVHKSTYSAFYETDLQSFLKKHGRTEVIVTGVMTNLCCETSAREAFIRGFRVFFSTDATATSNEDLHLSTLKNLAYGFAYLVDCKKLKSCLTSGI